jgi:hypothetical protein
MMKPLAILLYLVVNCFGDDFAREMARHKKLAAQPTPQQWRTGSVWRFVTARRGGKQEVLTFRVTDQLATTCTNGVWRKLILLEGNVGPGSEPAYLVEGCNLSVSLHANICDANDDIFGDLRGGTFIGKRRVSGLFGGEYIGRVRGSYVP